MIQTLIVAAIVAFAVWQLVRNVLPKKTAKPSTGCGSGCDTCGACKVIRFDVPEPRDRQ